MSMLFLTLKGALVLFGTLGAVVLMCTDTGLILVGLMAFAFISFIIGKAMFE